MGNETTVLSFELDFGNSTQKFNSLITAGEKLNQTITDIQKNTTKILPDTNEQFDETRKNINNTIDYMSSIDTQIKSGKLDSYQISVKTNEFNSLARSLSSMLADVRSIQSLTENIGKQTTTYTQNQVKNLMPQLMNMAREATSIYKQTGNLASDNQIVGAIKATQKYQQIKSSLLGNDKTGSSAIDDILRLAVIKGVGQVQRGTFMSRLSAGNGLDKHVFDSFQDMLPSGLKKINSSNKVVDANALLKMQESDRTVLSADEMKKLYSLLLNNQFATDAAEAAKIATRKNGSLFVQKGVTRGMVKAMGSHLYDDLITAAKGMDMYGITDVNDPAVWDRIARKSNKRFMGGMSAARRLSDDYSWFEAERYAQKDYDKIYKDSINMHSNGKKTMSNAGAINFSPTPNSYEVAYYTLDDLKNKRNWNDRSKKYEHYSDYHHVVADESMHLNTIMQHSKSGIKKHNSYLDDVIYLEIDPRLSDPNLSEVDRKKLIDEYANVFQHGISGQGKNNLNEKYVLSRINPKMGAEFIRKSIYDKINSEDPTYFSAGLGKTEFSDWKTFAAAMEYRNKNATPGKSIQKLFGSDLPQNIVVVDLENTTKGLGGAGLNGASIISNKFVQKGFQGRAHGIKTALTSVDIDKLIETYGDQLYLTSYTGDENEKETVVDASGNERKVGKRIKIDKGVDMIINAADLKNADARFSGMTNAEITNIVKQDIAKGIYANKLYGDANGKTRWISGQLAQTLAIDKDSSMLFARAFMDHYRNVGNYDYAMKYLFTEGEEHDLLSAHPELFGNKSIQNRIADYREAIMARMLSGDIMLPDEVQAYKGMAAPWLIDAFNEDMKLQRQGENKSAFQNLSGNIQKRLNKLTLGDNRVLFLKTLASQLGLGRYPATGQSIQSVMNAKGDKSIAKFAESIGLDPYGLYISTTSPLMQLLQDADFDGDIMEIIELATNEDNNASVAKVMNKIISATVKRNKELYATGKISEEELARRDALLKRTRDNGSNFSTDFSTKKGATSAALWTSNYALQASGMGSPNATVRNAFQMLPDAIVATALIDADRQYSKNSVEGKKGEGRETSSEQMAVIGKYKPFSEFYKMVEKSKDEFGNINPEELRKKNFFGVNLPSASMSGSMRTQNLARFIAKNVYGYDINSGYNWDEIFQIAHGDIDSNTAVGKMQLGLKDTIMGIINADYLAPSDVMVAQLLQLKARAQEEETNRVATERKNGLLKGLDLKSKDETIARRRLASAGGNVIDNLVSYALTQNSSILGENRDTLGQLNQLGITNVIGRLDLSKYLSGEVSSAEALKMEASAKRLLTKNDKLSQLETLDKEQRENAIDRLKFSPSLFSKLMKDPTGWAAHYLADQKDNEMTPYTHLGTAVHEAIESFMQKRMDYNKTNNGAMMPKEELEKAAQESIGNFESYLESKVGKPGLSKADLNKLKTTSSYKNIVDYLSKDLVNLFPEEEYEVAAIEGKLGFDLGNKIRKNNKGESEAVTSEGYFDLLFRNRKTGNYVIGDMKNYPNPSPHDEAMFKMQQQLYASALPAYIAQHFADKPGELEGLHIVKPIQGITEKINSSPDAIAQTLQNAQKGVQMIQSLAENGFQVSEVLKVSKALDDMFGGNGFTAIASDLKKAVEQEQTRAEHIQAQIKGDNGEGVSAALVMHDEYNKSMKTLSGINSFVWKNDEEKQQLRYNQWYQNYQQLAMQSGTVRDLRNSGMDIQADMLENEIKRTQTSLDTLLPKSAVSDLEKAYELLRNINNEETSSKQANGKVQEFKQLTEQIERASDAYEILESKINSNKESIKEKKAELRGEKDADRRVALDNEIQALEKQTQKDYQPAARKAKALQQKLDAEKEDYIRNNKINVWNELLDKKENLQAIASGNSLSNVKSITGEIQQYVNSIKQAKADAKLYAKEFGIDEDSEEYTNYIKELNSLMSLRSFKGYREKTIDNSLLEFESRRHSVAGNVDSMRVSSSEQIDHAVRAQTARIEKEKADLERRFKGLKKPERYNQLMNYYNSYDEETYRQQLIEDNKIRQQREDLRIDQTLLQGEQMKRHMYGRRGGIVARALDQRDSSLSQWKSRKFAIDEQLSAQQKKLAGMKPEDENYAKVQQQVDNLKNASKEAENAINSLQGPMSTVNAVAAQFGNTIGMIAQRLGRQLFYKALNETKRFVKEFDSSMNEIQAITLKSDQEMKSVRSGTISKALGLRTSVSNVATTEAALYRQGLSDSEVSSRTESIIKFATVTKLNVAEATKIITTALQNDLVPSAEAAMDALVALGDSAATTAAEIGKGMQKAAASAKVAGVSYAELTALLTIGTSDTQLSGTQVGTALQTVFSRMRRLSISGFTADQNGEKTTASDAEAALKSVGVDLWDNKTIGKMRSAYEVLSDLSKVWQNLSDAQKNIVMNSLAGTRQTNVFSTLMEGMSEDGGATLDKYLGLAEGSEGVTQTKYEIAMQSLAASMDTLRSSWDSVVESFTNSGIVTGVLDGVSGFLQTIAGLSSGGGGQIGVVFTAITAGIAGMAAACLAAKTAIAPISSLLGMIIGVGAFAVGTSVISGIASLFPEEESKRLEREYTEDTSFATNKAADRNLKNNARTQAIEETKKYGEELKKAIAENDKIAESVASEKLENSLHNLAEVFPEVSDAILSAIQNLANWTTAVNEAQKVADKYAKEDYEQNIIDYADASKRTINKRYEVGVKSIDKTESARKAEQGLVTAMKRGGKQVYSRIVNTFFSGTGVDNSRPMDSLNIDYIDDLLNYDQGKDRLIDSFSIALKESPAFKEYAQTWLSENHPNIKEDLLNTVDRPDRKRDYANYVADLYKDINNKKEQNPYENEKAIRQFNLDFMSGELANFVQENVSEDYTSEMITKALELELDKLLSSENSSKYLNDNGLISDPSVIIDYFKDHWIAGGSKYTENLVKNNLKRQDYAYHINTGAGENDFIGFATKEAAEDYARRNKISVKDILNSTGMSSYQTAAQIISANRIANNENKLQTSALNMLYGYVPDVKGLSDSQLDQLARSISGGKGASESPRKYASRLLDIQEQIKSGKISLTESQLKQVSTLPKGIREYKDLDSLMAAYQASELDSEFANVISNTPEALIGYLEGDVETIAQALENIEPGKATPRSQGEQTRRLMNLLANKTDYINQLRNEKDLQPYYENLQKYFGDNTDQILNAMLSGSYVGSDLENFVNQTIAEKSITLGTGKQFTNVRTAELASQVLGFSDWTAAQEGLKDKWTTDEWSALESKYPDLKRYMQMSEADKKSQEGLNLKRNIEIQMSVAGVSQLEEANKVLEGTTSLIEALQKGGEIELKAKFSFDQGLYDTQQQRAMLANGTEEDKIQTLMSITGWSKARVQKNREAAESYANSYFTERETLTAETLNQIAEIKPELAAQLASAYGYTNVGGDMNTEEALKEFGKNKSYEYFIDQETGKLNFWYENNGKRMSTEAWQDSQDLFNKLLISYVKDESNNSIDYEEPLSGLRRSYTPAQIAEMRNGILEGTQTANSNKDIDLYKQVASSLSTYELDYLAMKNAAPGKYSEKEIQDAKQKAYAAYEQSTIDDIERQALEDAENAKGTVIGAKEYALLNYQINNKAGLAAETAWLNRGSYSDIKSFLTNAEGIENWNVLAATEEYRRWEEKFLNPDTGELKEGISYSQAMQGLANLTQNYQGAGFASRAEQVRQARAALKVTENRGTNVNGEALRSILGEEAYSKWLNGEDISNYQYYQTKLANYEAGLSGLTTSQKLKGIQKVISLESQDVLGGANREEIMDYLSGWSNAEEYFALAGLEREKTPEELERFNTLKQELENFQKDTQIQFEVEGVQTLENAGKILEGTAATVEKLKKGGIIELEVQTTIRSQAFSAGQTEARLNEGTWAEQNAAAMQILGMSEEEFFLNRAQNIQKAKNYKAATRQETAASWLEKYNGATDKQSIIDSAKEEGYEAVLDDQGNITGFQYNSSLVRKKTQSVATVNERYARQRDEANLTRLYSNIANGYMSAKGNNGVYSIGDFLGAQDYEKLLQNDSTFASMIAAEVSEDELLAYAKRQSTGQQYSPYEQYETAWKNLFGGKNITLETLAQARSVYAEGTQSEREYYNSLLNALPSDLRDYVLASDEEAARMNVEEIVENYDLSQLARNKNTSFAAANAYAALRYQQNNKAGLAANNLYTALATGEFENASEIEQVFTGEGLQNWNDLLESAPELTKEFQDMGHTIGEDGKIDWSVIQQQEGGLSAALDDLIKIISEHSLDYKGAVYDTREDIFNDATNYWNNKSQGNYDAFASVVGSDIAARYKAEDTFLTSEEENYANMLLENYGKGIIGLTQEQKLFGANQMINAIETGTYKDIYGNASQDMINTYAGSVTGLQELIDEYNKGNTTTEEFAERLNEVKAELAGSNFEARGFGDGLNEASKAVTNIMTGSKKATKEIANLRSKALSSQDLISATRKARGKSGKSLDSTTKGLIANYLGVDAKDVEKYSKEYLDGILNEIEDQVNKDFSTNNLKPMLQSALNTLSENMEPAQLKGAIEFVTDTEGNLDIGNLASVVSQYNESLAAALREYQGIIAEYHARVIATSDGEGNGDVYAIGDVTSSLKGASTYNKGGGGGGGGKSKAQKAIDTAKHSTVDAEHRLKLAQTEETKANSANEDQRYVNSLNTQISIYNELSEIYKKNIADLEAQRKSVKADSDDWWSLTDAINGYIESLEEVGVHISEINAKRLTYLVKQQENVDADQKHEQTMTSGRADYAKLIEDYDTYFRLARDLIQQNKQQRATNNAQIAELQAEYNRYVKTEPNGANSDNAIETLRKIQAIQEENLSLQNEAVQALQDIQSYEIEIIRQQAERQATVDRATASQAGQYAQLAGNAEDYALQRSYLSQKVQSNTSIIGILESALPSLEEKVRATTPGTPEFETAYQNYAEVISRIGDLRLSNQSDLAEIESSYLTEITQGFENATMAASHYADMAQSIADIYKNAEYFEDYRKSMEDAITLYDGLRAAAHEEAVALTEKFNKMKETDVGYEDTARALQEAENKEISYIARIQESTRAIQENYLEQQKLVATRRLMASETNTAIAGTYAPLYKKNLQYEEYEGALNTQIEGKQSKIASNKNEIAQLEQDILNDVYTDPKAFQDAVEQLYAYEKENATLTVDINSLQASLQRSAGERIDAYLKRNNLGDDQTIAISGIRAGINQNMQNYAGQAEELIAGKQAKYSERERIGQAAEELYNVILSHNDENPYANEEAKMADIEQYNKYIQQYTKLTAEAIADTYAIEQANYNQIELENSDKMRSPAQNIAFGQATSQVYLGAENFEFYRSTLDDINEETLKSIQIRQEHIKSLQEYMEEIKDNPALLRSVTDEINREYVSIAQETKAIQDNTKAIEQNRLAELQLLTTRKNLIDQSKSQMAGTYASLAQSDMRWGEQRELLAAQNRYNAGIRENNTAEIADLEKILAADEFENAESKQQAIERYYSLLNENANLETQILSNHKAIQQSLIDQTNSNFNDMTRGANQTVAMNEVVGQIYLGDENFDAYRDSIVDTNAALRTIIDARKEHIATLTAELELVKDNPSLVREVTDQINAEYVSLARDTKSLQDNTKAIEENRLSTLQLITTRRNLSAQTNAQLAGMRASSAQSNWDWEGYREGLTTQNKENQTVIRNNATEAATLKMLIDADQFTNEEERQKAIERYDSLITDIASLRNQAEENQRSIKKSYTEEISNNTNLALQKPNYINDVLNQWASRYSTVGNNEGYQNLMAQQITVSQDMLDTYRNAAAQLRMQVAGMEENTPEWYEATEKLYEFEEAIQKTRITLEESAEAIKTSIVNGIIKTYEEASRGYQQEMNIAGTYAGAYETSQMYNEYRNMLELQTSDRNAISEAITEEITRLQEQLPGLVGTEQYERVIQEIYSMQSQRASLYAENIQAQHQIADSRATEELTNRQNQIDKFDRRINNATLLAGYYADEKDVERYTEAIQEQSDAIMEKQAYEQHELEILMDLASQTPENTEAYKKLEQQIYDSAYGVAQMDIELLKLNKDLKNMQLDEMFERMSRIDEVADHQLSMMNAVTGRYQTRGELSNVNIMLGHDTDLQTDRATVIRSFISELEDQLKLVDEGSDEYWRIASAIMKYESALESTTSAIEDNKKKIDENTKAILQNRIAVEDSIDAEIKNRIREQREMLSGTTTIQEKILNIIRKNYQDQWELADKDWRKKKEALEKEKSLINERLQMRKKALSDEREDEELAEYQRQLALISADSSRTKEAKELRAKIQEMQQNRAMSLAEDEANSQIEQIDDEIQSIDDLFEYQQEWREAYLEDAHNFVEVVDTLISGSFEDISYWVKQNDETYKNSLDESREEMLNSWEDTWKQMRGIVDTYFDEIRSVTGDVESYITYMQASTEWVNASDTKRALLEKEARERYEAMINGEAESFEAVNYEHNDSYAISGENKALSEAILNLVSTVTGAGKIDVAPMDTVDFYGANEYENANLGLEDNSEFMAAINSINEINVGLIDEFKNIILEANESQLAKEIENHADNIARATEQRDILLAILNKDPENAEVLAQLSELNFTIAQETANKQALEDQFTQNLSEKLNVSIEEVGKYIELIAGIAGDSFNNILTVVGESGAQQLELAANSITENSNVLTSFVESLDGTLSARIQEVFTQASGLYEQQGTALSTLSSDISKAIEDEKTTESYYAGVNSSNFSAGIEDLVSKQTDVNNSHIDRTNEAFNTALQSEVAYDEEKRTSDSEEFRNRIDMLSESISIQSGDLYQHLSDNTDDQTSKLSNVSDSMVRSVEDFSASATQITDNATTFSEKADTLVVQGIEPLTKSEEDLVSSVRDSSDKYSSSSSDLVSKLDESLAGDNGLIAKLQGTDESLTTSAATISDAIVGSDGLVKKIQDTDKNFSEKTGEMFSSIDSAVDALTGNDSVKSSVEDMNNSVINAAYDTSVAAEAMSGASETMNTASGAMEDAADALNGDGGVTSSVNELIASLGQDGGFISQLTSSNEAFQTSATELLKGLRGEDESFAATAKAAVENFTNESGSVVGSVKTSAENAVNAMNTAAGKSVSAAATDLSTTATTKINEATTKLSGAATGKIDDFKKVTDYYLDDAKRSLGGAKDNLNNASIDMNIVAGNIAIYTDTLSKYSDDISKYTKDVQDWLEKEKNTKFKVVTPDYTNFYESMNNLITDINNAAESYKAIAKNSQVIEPTKTKTKPSEDEPASYNHEGLGFSDIIAQALSQLDETKTTVSKVAEEAALINAGPYGYSFTIDGQTFAERAGFGTKEAAETRARTRFDTERNKLVKAAKTDADKQRIGKTTFSDVLVIYKNGEPESKVTKKSEKTEENKKSFTAAQKYAKGGLVDYTGFAWVDGTKSKPESFLDAYDTQTLRAMMDSFNYIRRMPTITSIDSAAYGNTSNIGDVHVTINEAEFSDEADFEYVAKRVGQEFTKELQKSGFNVARYNM